LPWADRTSPTGSVRGDSISPGCAWVVWSRSYHRLRPRLGVPPLPREPHCQTPPAPSRGRGRGWGNNELSSGRCVRPCGSIPIGTRPVGPLLQAQGEALGCRPITARPCRGRSPIRAPSTPPARFVLRSRWATVSPDRGERPLQGRGVSGGPDPGRCPGLTERALQARYAETQSRRDALG
jgi:hypothetical protein